MDRKKKLVTSSIAFLAVAVGTVAVVLLVVRTPAPDVAGIYTALNGSEIHLAEDGSLTEMGLPTVGGFPRVPLRYRVEGSNIIVVSGNSDSSPKGLINFKIQSDGGLIGWDTAWNKLAVAPPRPPSLVGTYTATPGDGQTLALDKNGAVYTAQPLPTGETVRGGTWVAAENTVTVTYPSYGKASPLKITYTVNGNSLAGEGKELVKTSERAIVPAT